MRKLTKFEIIDIFRGVFPNIRDDVAILVSNPKYMGDKERGRLRHYQVVDRGLVYEFDASLLVCVDDSQMLTVAKYEVNGREVTHAVFSVNGK